MKLWIDDIRPVRYTGIWRVDKEGVQKFLQDCLNLMEEE